MKKFKFIILTLFLLLIAVISSSCSGSAAIASSWPGLSVDKENVYIAYNQSVYALNIGNGSEKWHFPSEGNNKSTFFAPPEKTPDGQLLVGSYNNVLHSLDPLSGQEKWVFTEANNRYIANPLVVDDMIYAPTGGKYLYALDAQGNLKWQYETEGALWAQPLYSTECDCIYLPSMDHYLYVINAKDGALLWKSEKFNGSIVGTPALSAEGDLYFGTFSSEIIKLNLETRQSTQLLATDGWVWGGPILHDNRLYFGDLRGSFYAVDAKTGAIDWKIQTDGPIIASPNVNSEYIYFGTASGTLYKLDPQGNSIWNPNPKFDGSIYSSPQASSELLLVTLFKSDKLLVALDQNGAIKWSFQPAKK